MKIARYIAFILFPALSCALISGCSSQRDTTVGRGMQNLTARYNILYNARLLLDESQKNIEKAHYDDYSQILSVYEEPGDGSPASGTGNLDSVIRKANVIINEKANSNYVDDAYYLIAKANYLKANFFNAAEFFTYVFKTYPREYSLRLSSLAWKTRALLQLNNIEEAKSTLDSAFKYLDPADKKAYEVYAASAQFLITTGNEQGATEMLEKAISSSAPKEYVLRWRFILAQAQERSGLKEAALANYKKVTKSNVSFEMAFNANLNCIRLEDGNSGHKIDRIARLRALLKSDKNKDFHDQIYFRIADIYLEDQQLQNAIANYQQAIRKSTVNKNQKGLAYLRLADLYFKNGDYSRAKAYYDTTLTTLSPSFKGYETIRRKADNLELLAGRFRIIAHEDTLQTLARLTPEEREARIGELVREQAEKSIGVSNVGEPQGSLPAGSQGSVVGGEGKFYFNNSAALSQGYSDFRRRWGNRQPGDNWRRGSKTASEVTESMNAATLTGTSQQTAGNTTNEERLKQIYLSALPVTPEQLRLSNERKAAAYYDIATFYKDQLKDNDEAVSAFEDLLKQVPGTSYQPAVYYNLYILYQDKNRTKSDEYKKQLLNEYPGSTFAQVVVNPSYGQESDKLQLALNTAYTHIYELYNQRNYSGVIQQTKEAEQKYGKNKLSPQFGYLKALAVGHTEKLLPFENTLQTVADSFATDQVVVPLVKQHLEYINKHREELAARPTALLDYDADNDIFMEPERVTVPTSVTAVTPKTLPAVTAGKTVQPLKKIPEPEKTSEGSEKTSGESAKTSVEQEKTSGEPEKDIQQQPVTAPVPPSIFSLPDSAEYYFVINVNSPVVNLSPSRFGVGQFNRSKYSGLSIKHQLKSVNNENQLIFVGPFYSKAAVADYEKNILPLMKDIMKIPADRYDTFVISKGDLEKLNTRTMINLYLEFYKNRK